MNSSSPFSSSTLGAIPVSQAPAATRLDFIRKTYLLFTASVLVSLVGGVVSLTSPIHLMVMRSGFLALLLMIPLVWVAGAVSRTPGLNYVALFGFTFFMGLVMAPFVAMYEVMAPGVVGQAAFLTVVVFGSLTAYAFISRTDFNFLGGMLFVALIALILGGLANAIWFKSPAMSYFSAWISLMIFSGFVLFDTSRIIHRFSEDAYCAAALELFLDFFNMFMAILRILSGNRR